MRSQSFNRFPIHRNKRPINLFDSTAKPVELNDQISKLVQGTELSLRRFLAECERTVVFEDVIKHLLKYFTARLIWIGTYVESPPSQGLIVRISHLYIDFTSIEAGRPFPFAGTISYRVQWCIINQKPPAGAGWTLKNNFLQFKETRINRWF